MYIGSFDKIAFMLPPLGFVNLSTDRQEIAGSLSETKQLLYSIPAKFQYIYLYNPISNRSYENSP